MNWKELWTHLHISIFAIYLTQISGLISGAISRVTLWNISIQFWRVYNTLRLRKNSALCILWRRDLWLNCPRSVRNFFHQIWSIRIPVYSGTFECGSEFIMGSLGRITFIFTKLNHFIYIDDIDFWWLNIVCICFYAYVQTWIYIRIYLSVSPDIMDMAKCCFRSHLANSICHSRYYNLFGIGILNKKWYDNTLTTVQKYRG